MITNTTPTRTGAPGRRTTAGRPRRPFLPLLVSVLAAAVLVAVYVWIGVL